MRIGLRFRPIGWIAAIGTLAAMAATLVVAASGGAAPGPLKLKEVNFEAACILAPGVLNETGTIKVHQVGEAPETVEQGGEFNVVNNKITTTTPVNWGETLFASGSRSARGAVTSTIVDIANATPASKNIAKPPEFPSGLPFVTKVENAAVSFTVPSEGRSFNSGPYTATGAVGSTATGTVDTAPGFKEVSAGHYEATGQGIISETTGFNELGEANIGPFSVNCTAPAGVVVSESTIVHAPPPTETTTDTTTLFPPTTSGPPPTMTTTTTTTIPCICITLNDKLTGSVTVHKLGQKITLPEGCTFRGESKGIPGPFEANTKCPPFGAAIKLLGLIPTTIGLNLTEAGPVTGRLEPEASGKVLMTGTAKDNIEVTSLSVFGLKLPLSCTTAEPVVFAINGSATPQELITIGVTSNGETTLPAVRCNGFLGGIAGSLLTLLMSGPNNPYTLTIAP